MERRPFSDISYRQFLKEEKLMGSRCRLCNTLFAPPRAMCINCYDSDMEWVEMKGKGKLSAFTCITVAPPFMVAQGHNRKNPYCTAVVELDEGVRVDARIEGVDATRPETIKIGTPLKAKFIHRGEGDNTKTVLGFEPQ